MQLLRSPKFGFLRIVILIGAMIGAGGVALAQETGIFDDQTDIGSDRGLVLSAGSADFEENWGTYSVSGSGTCLGAQRDGFHYVWTRVSGDVSLSADVAFITPGGDAQKMALLVIRQDLASDSAFAAVAVHGDGSTSLVGRDGDGGLLQEVKSAVSSAARARIRKVGEMFSISVAALAEELQPVDGSVSVPITGTFYVGIGVCSHERNAVDIATFSNIELVELGSAGR